MRKNIHILLAILLLFLFCGCGSDNGVNSPQETDGLSLLGLVNNRTFNYIETDTNITFDPFTVSFSDTILTITITGSSDDWIISNGQKPIINLKVSSLSIIQNGYWTMFNAQDSLVYIAAPPVLMDRTLNLNKSWDYYTPFYNTGTTPILFPFYISNFGFKVTKMYTGREDIITPAGEFSAFRFELKLYTSAFGDQPVAEIVEYYVPNIGLVKQDMVNGGLRRSIILVNYTD